MPAGALEDPTTPVAVKTAFPPGASVTGALMLPLPDEGHAEPDVAPQFQMTFVTLIGKMFTTVALTTVLGPAFVTVSV
jgi:hypothetical protein